MRRPLRNPGSFLPILIPNATVFISSFCIMVLELVAARLIAKHLGSSLYTWTAVIGVVLSGITIGNYLGGRIADRFHAQKSLALLFVVSSASCVLTVILNNIVGDWVWLWTFSWPIRVFGHVTAVFMLPSTLLGMISPVVAKMALDKGLATGRTVGSIYAWGAAGSIIGTFVTGYYLIAWLGTALILWSVGGLLLIMGILYWTRQLMFHIWLLLFMILVVLGIGPWQWCKKAGAAIALREKPDPRIVYEDESQYCYIAVKKRAADDPNRLMFIQDKLMHSEIALDNVLDLKYYYEKIQAAVTHLMNEENKKLSVLVIGGGGYVFPRYIEKVWPGSRVDVAEIDPGVTEAAMKAFGLESNTTINTFTMDARNYVTQLLEQERKEGEKTRYDFIYEDAAVDYSIPYQLTTKQFNDKIAEILTDDGAYMITLMDIYDSGLFVGAFVNTLEHTFPYVYVITEKRSERFARINFVIVGSKRKISFENLDKQSLLKDFDLWVLNDSEIETLRQKSKGIILTDDYAPVENLLAPVVREHAMVQLGQRYFIEALELSNKGKFDESIERYKDLIKVTPSSSVMAYDKIGTILASQGKLEEAVSYFKKALEYNEKAEMNLNVAGIHYKTGMLLKELGGNESEISEHLTKAFEQYSELSVMDQDAMETLN